MIRTLIAFCAAAACLRAEARVVINEILYHPPDAPGVVEFIELHNTGAEPVALRGWSFTEGVEYRFEDSARIEANGFLVLASNKEAFQNMYGFEPSAIFKGSLKRKGEKLELSDAAGKKADSVKFKDSGRWPRSPDGEGASLERICPSAKSSDPANWAPGPFGENADKCGGTPGKQNASFAATLPPVITDVTFSPRTPRPGQPVTVSAKITTPGRLDRVRLAYRIAGPGAEKQEESMPMQRAEGVGEFRATIPGQEENAIVRFKIEAIDAQKASRVEPAPFEVQPAFSYFVHDKFNVGKIPWGFLVFVDEADHRKEQNASRQNGPGGPDPNREAFMARMAYEANTEMAPLWLNLCLTQKLNHAQLAQAAPALARQQAVREKTLAKFLESTDDPLKRANEWSGEFQENLRRALNPVLDQAQRAALGDWQKSKTNTSPAPFTPERVLQRFCNIEAAFFYLTTQSNLSESAYGKVQSAAEHGLSDREKFVARVRAAMQGQNEDGQNLIGEVQELQNRVHRDLLAALDDAGLKRGFETWQAGNNPFAGGPGQDRDSSAVEAAQGRNAFVYVPAETGEPELFDFVKANRRNAGYKVHFAKHHALRGMTGINLIFEYRERFVLAEPLAYEVYRRAGNAAEQSDFIRLFVDGRPLAYHLLLEQPNRSFLKRNRIRDDGNLYKILWYQQGVVRQHEKKTNLGSTHEDVESLVEALGKAKDEEQWQIIEKNFNVNQVATYFAVNMVLSHWDGFFNNYFAYHDVRGTGKWEMYPWDQDKTWGFHDSLPDGEIFYDMPLTFGMEGDRPPGYPADRPAPRGIGHSWWRAGGFFSAPLLANPRFRKIFLARTREILDRVYTEEVFFPILDQVRDRLQDEVKVRAEVLKQSPDEAQAQLQRDVDSLKGHLKKRREFLLSQDELKTASR